MRMKKNVQACIQVASWGGGEFYRHARLTQISTFFEIFQVTFVTRPDRMRKYFLYTPFSRFCAVTSSRDGRHGDGLGPHHLHKVTVGGLYIVYTKAHESITHRVSIPLSIGDNEHVTLDFIVSAFFPLSVLNL